MYDKYDHEFRSVGGVVSGLRRLGAGNPPLHRFRVGLDFVIAGHREVNRMIEHHAERARALGEQLRMPGDVLMALSAAYEQWDGRGWPGKLRGAEVPLPARLAQLAEFIEVAHRLGGVPGAQAMARRRAGKQFDPKLAAVVHAQADAILADLHAVSTWDAVIAAEPALAVVLDDEQLDSALLALANFVDLKSPYTLGHAHAVADLATRAAATLQLQAGEARQVRHAALVQGFGRLGVSNAIWDKPGPLGAGEWERVRMHPYITERMLRQSAALAPLGLTHVQFVLLAATWWLNSHGEDPNQLSVARQAGTDVKMTSEVLRKLEAKGLIVRTVDAADTRARRIRVTERGGELAMAAVTAVEGVDTAFFRAVPDPAALLAMLRTLARGGG